MVKGALYIGASARLTARGPLKTEPASKVGPPRPYSPRQDFPWPSKKKPTEFPFITHVTADGKRFPRQQHGPSTGPHPKAPPIT